MPAPEVPDAARPPGGSICFVTADARAPSFRIRLATLMPLLQTGGWHCTVQVLPKGLPGWRILKLREALRASRAVVLHKLRLFDWELRWLHAWQPASWFDVDDAIWLRQPRQAGQTPPASPRRERKFAAMCRQAAVTSVGNEWLADKARAAGGRVQVFPTAVDTRAYAGRPAALAPGQVIVWVGLPGNLRYLQPLRPVLARLVADFPALRLRVISSAWPDWPEVPVERVAWSADGEAPAICSADIGIMPLTDDEFTRGKCAFKLLQYMAAGLPCVASPVGANREVVVPSQTGLLADTAAQWEAALRELLLQPALRQQMGQAGRARAVAHYDTQVILPRMAALLRRLAEEGRPTPPR